jgi:hypothetical protein
MTTLELIMITYTIFTILLSIVHDDNRAYTEGEE